MHFDSQRHFNHQGSNQFSPNYSLDPIQSKLFIRLSKKYNSTRQNYYMDTINSLFAYRNQNSESSQCKIDPKLRVSVADFKFNDEFQYMDKLHQAPEIIIEMAELSEYYKYYIQHPIILDESLFKLLYCYYDRKKRYFYGKIKHMLNITNQKVTLQSGNLRNSSVSQKKLTLNKLSNILKQISSLASTERVRDESECFINLQRKFMNKYGNGIDGQMSEIDKLYYFKSSNTDLQLIKNLKLKKSNGRVDKRGGKGSGKKEKSKMIMQSTNNSSLQQVQPYYHPQRNYSQHDLARKVQLEFNIKSRFRKNEEPNQRTKTEFSNKTSFNISKNNVTNAGFFKRQEKEKKNRLKKKSCDNLKIRKFRTLANDLLQNTAKQSIRISVLKSKREQREKLSEGKLRKEKLKSQPHRRSNSCENQQTDEGAKKGVQKSDSQKRENKKKQWSSPQQVQERNIKKTIEIFKSRIRNDIREIIEEQKNNSTELQDNFQAQGKSSIKLEPKRPQPNFRKIKLGL